MQHVPRPPTEAEVSIAAARMAVEAIADLTKGSLRADHVKHILDALDAATRRKAAAEQRASDHAQYADDWETEARRLRDVETVTREIHGQLVGGGELPTFDEIARRIAGALAAVDKARTPH
jgi:hypothetical protein